MSMSEPGAPYFRRDTPRRDRPYRGGYLTTAGLWRSFAVTQDSPHEPWCLHFEWGPCSCGPTEGEVFVDTGTSRPPSDLTVLLVEARRVRSGWLDRLRRRRI